MTDQPTAVLKFWTITLRRIIESELLHVNIGVGDTLNHGIEAAQGHWIARMDADDISLPHRFERQLQWLEQTSADICGSWIKLFGNIHGNVIKYPQTDEANRMRMIFDPPVAHPAVMEEEYCETIALR